MTDILHDEDKILYSVYRSKYNKEYLDTLRDMTLNEFLKHREFVIQQDDLELAANKDQEERIKQK